MGGRAPSPASGTSRRTRRCLSWMARASSASRTSGVKPWTTPSPPCCRRLNLPVKEGEGALDIGLSGREADQEMNNPAEAFRRVSREKPGIATKNTKSHKKGEEVAQWPGGC